MNNLSTIISLQLKTKNKITIAADGNCMKPVINNTDQVEISILEKYCIGDIVLVSVQNQLRIHRIIAKDKKGYITKGDHSYLPDKRIDNKILGKAIINCTQGRSLCSNRIRLFIRANISNLSGKSYRKYLKVNSKIFRKIYILVYKMGNFLLFYI